MIKDSLLGLLDKEIIMAGWELAVGTCVTVAVGVAAGTLFTMKARKKIREELKNASNTVTIEVHDLEKLKIERIE